MTHHDAPSGQPYSEPPIWERAGTLPPPTPPPFPNPGGGGDGGGGRKHRKWPWAVGALALIVVGGVAAGNSTDPAPKVALPSATASPTPATGPEAFMADVARVGFGDKDTSDQAFLTVGNKTCEAFNDGVSYGDQVSAYLSTDAKPTQLQAETVIRSAVRNLCPEYDVMLP